MKDNNKVIAWHFIRDDSTIKTTSLKRPIKVFPGQVLRHRGKIIPCKRGLHASKRPLDALCWARGSVVCRVECSDRIVYHKEYYMFEEKLVCGRREVLWMLDATRVLHEFSIWCAREALKLVGNPDPRSLEALRVKELWLDGKATDEELKKARNSAWDVCDHICSGYLEAAMEARAVVVKVAARAAQAEAPAARAAARAVAYLEAKAKKQQPTYDEEYLRFNKEFEKRLLGAKNRMYT